MANTYTQLYVQLVFGVQHRESLIKESIREEVQKYLTGIVSRNKHKMLAVFCMPDHAHVFVGLHPNQSISDLVNELKSNSSKWINEQKLIKHHFNWQGGFGAFSYHKSKVDTICHYVNNQKDHHQKRGFREEYLDLLREFDIDYDDRYVFDFFD